MTRIRTILSLYARIGRTYVAWARTLVTLAVVVFVPLGLLHAITVHADIGSLDLDGGLKLFGLAAALLAIAATGLLGEVFYAGAVAIALTHPHDGRPPPLREVVRMISYRRLIVVDVLYGLLVSAGLVILVVPGVLAFVYLGLAAPIVEIQRRSVREAFSHSLRLVRGNFWVVAAVLIPIELAGDVLINLMTSLSHSQFGESLFGEWLADSVANVAATPFYAVAAVLLTITLIAEKDGGGPGLHSSPSG